MAILNKEELTIEQIKEWKDKAEKWDKLAEKIERFYFNEDGSEYTGSGDLCDIGEEACVAFGWL